MKTGEKIALIALAATVSVWLGANLWRAVDSKLGRQIIKDMEGML